MKKWKTTLAMLVLVALGAAYLQFVEKGRKTTEEKEELGKKLVAEFKTSNAERMTVTLQQEAGEKKFVFERIDDDAWRMAAPLKVRADRSAVEGVMDSIQWATKDATIKPKEGEEFNIEQYGLKSPKAVIHVKQKKSAEEGPSEFTVKVGKKSSVGHHAYVSMGNDKTVYAISDGILDKLKEKTNEWRDKQVADFNRIDAEKIDVVIAKTETEPERQISLSREEGAWRMVQPVADRTDETKVSDLVQKLADARVEPEDFISEDDSDLKKYGLDAPRLSFAVTLKSEEKDEKAEEKGKPARTWTLLIGAKAEEKEQKLYAKLKEEPTVFAVKEALLSELSPETNSLRDKRLIRFFKDKVWRLQVTSQAGSVVCERADAESSWEFKEIEGVRPDGDALKELLDEMDKAEIKDFVNDAPKDLAEYGLDSKSAVEVHLIGENDESLARLLAGKTDAEGEKLYAKRSDQPCVFAVDTGAVSDLAAGPQLALRDRLITDFGEPEVKSFVLARKDKVFECKRSESDAAKWELVKPAKGATDEWAVRDLVRAACSLKVKKYIEQDPKDLAKYGLDKPEITLSMECEEEVAEKKPEEENEPEKGADEKKPEEKKAEPEKEADEAPSKVDRTPAEEPAKRKVTRKILIGKRQKEDDDFSPRYAMVEGTPIVFTLSDMMVGRFEAELGSTDVAAIAKKDVNKLIVQRGEEIVRFEKKDDKWFSIAAEKEEEVENKQAITDLLDLLVDFDGTGVAEYSQADAAKYGLDKPALALTIGREAVSEVMVKVGKPAEEEKYPVTGPSSSFILWATKRPVEKIEALLPKPPEEEKPEAEAKPEEGAAEKKPEEKAAPADKPEEKKPTEKKPEETEQPETPEEKKPEAE